MKSAAATAETRSYRLAYISPTRQGQSNWGGVAGCGYRWGFGGAGTQWQREQGLEEELSIEARIVVNESRVKLQNTQGRMFTVSFQVAVCKGLIGESQRRTLSYLLSWVFFPQQKNQAFVGSVERKTDSVEISSMGEYSSLTLITTTPLLLPFAHFNPEIDSCECSADLSGYKNVQIIKHRIFLCQGGGDSSIWEIGMYNCRKKRVCSLSGRFLCVIQSVGSFLCLGDYYVLFRVWDHRGIDIVGNLSPKVPIPPPISTPCSTEPFDRPCISLIPQAAAQPPDPLALHSGLPLQGPLEQLLSAQSSSNARLSPQIQTPFYTRPGFPQCHLRHYHTVLFFLWPAQLSACTMKSAAAAAAVTRCYPFAYKITTSTPILNPVPSNSLFSSYSLNNNFYTSAALTRLPPLHLTMPPPIQPHPGAACTEFPGTHCRCSWCPTQSPLWQCPSNSSRGGLHSCKLAKRTLFSCPTQTLPPPLSSPKAPPQHPPDPLSPNHHLGLDDSEAGIPNICFSGKRLCLPGLRATVSKLDKIWTPALPTHSTTHLCPPIPTSSSYAPGSCSYFFPTYSSSSDTFCPSTSPGAIPYPRCSGCRPVPSSPILISLSPLSIWVFPIRTPSPRWVTPHPPLLELPYGHLIPNDEFKHRLPESTSFSSCAPSLWMFAGKSSHHYVLLLFSSCIFSFPIWAMPKKKKSICHCPPHN
ncbi:hypothetical protein VP01_3194g1 [Puccinia sorghi]|uniref:Uncharacterized protein n=1 Tax=Puccinia sorghi TaxID=27349 RepID=A0A0L6UZB7_9BASI|nr:hypothetical protein VP01_3194g1 [Puccinia sorghi]